MPKLIAPETRTQCCPCLQDEQQVGWERAAYIALEAMQDVRCRFRRGGTVPRSQR